MEQSDLLLDGLILAVNSGNIKFEKLEDFNFRAIYKGLTFIITQRNDYQGFHKEHYILSIMFDGSEISERLDYSASNKVSEDNKKIKELYCCVARNEYSILATAIYEINKLNK